MPGLPQANHPRSLKCCIRSLLPPSASRSFAGIRVSGQRGQHSNAKLSRALFNGFIKDDVCWHHSSRSKTVQRYLNVVDITGGKIG
jgi:hypothetical protein